MNLKMPTLILTLVSQPMYGSIHSNQGPVWGNSCPTFDKGSLDGATIYFSSNCQSAFIGPPSKGIIELHGATGFLDKNTRRECRNLKSLENRISAEEDKDDPNFDRIDRWESRIETIEKRILRPVGFILDTKWGDVIERARKNNPRFSINKIPNIETTAHSIGNRYDIAGITDVEDPKERLKLITTAGGSVNITAGQLCNASEDQISVEQLAEEGAVAVNVEYTFKPIVDLQYEYRFDGQFLAEEIQSNLKAFAVFWEGNFNSAQKRLKFGKSFDFKITGTPGQIFTPEEIRKISQRAFLQEIAAFTDLVTCASRNELGIHGFDINEDQKATVECTEIKLPNVANIPRGDQSDLLVNSEELIELRKELTNSVCNKVDGDASISISCKERPHIEKLLYLSQLITTGALKRTSVVTASKFKIKTFDVMHDYHSLSFTLVD